MAGRAVRAGGEVSWRAEEAGVLGEVRSRNGEIEQGTCRATGPRQRRLEASRTLHELGLRVKTGSSRGCAQNNPLVGDSASGKGAEVGKMRNGA